MRSFTTETRSLAKAQRSTRYTLARQFAAKYFPSNPIAGTYAVLDTVNATVDGQVLIPLTLDNGI